MLRMLVKSNLNIPIFNEVTQIQKDRLHLFWTWATVYEVEMDSPIEQQTMRSEQLVPVQSQILQPVRHSLKLRALVIIEPVHANCQPVLESCLKLDDTRAFPKVRTLLIEGSHCP